MPVTIPLSSTVATDGSELVHVTDGLSFFSVPSHVSAKMIVAPVCLILRLAGVSFIPVPVTLTLLVAVNAPHVRVTVVSPGAFAIRFPLLQSADHPHSR